MEKLDSQFKKIFLLNKYMIKISFCITCMNRFKQISKTLPKNLKDNIKNKDIVEFILVDFDSKDGLQKWIFENFRDEIKSGYLKYYFSDELIQWHAPIAKNTSTMLANGKYIVNLDCDNYTGVNGGKWVLDKFEKFGDNILLHQSLGIYKSGTMGRISMTKKNFVKLGGYNQQFFPMSHLDGDIVDRSKKIGMEYHLDPDREFNQAITNTKVESVKNCVNKNYEIMKQINYYISQGNIRNGEYIANNYTKKKNIGLQNGVKRIIL